jgi:hypothetical protein
MRRLGASRDDIAAEAGRTEKAWREAKEQVDNMTTLAQVSNIPPQAIHRFK